MLILVDAICVRFLNPYKILFGLGNSLRCRSIDKSLKKGEANCAVRPYDKIHSIEFLKYGETSYRIVASAGRELLVSVFHEDTFQFSSSFLIKLTDWISSIKLYEDGTLGIITGHCNAYNFLVDFHKKSAEILHTHISSDSPTLYCSHINSQKSWNDSIFLAGTALGELILWKPDQEVLFKVLAHNGVIFHIGCNIERLIITTTSDDRSIKIWNISNISENLILTESKQCFGHNARVFFAKMIEYDNQLIFATAGEDSVVCLWKESGELIFKKSLHFCSVIWSLDYCCLSKTIICSSSNGSIKTFQLDESLGISFDENVFNFNTNDCPAKVKYLENGVLVLVTKKSLVYFKPPNEEWCRLELGTNRIFNQLEVFKSCVYLVEQSTVLTFVWNEKLKTLLEKNISKIENFFIRSIQVLENEEVLLCNLTGECLLWNLKESISSGSFQIPKNSLKSSHCYAIVACKTENYLLVGDRSGNLHLFSNNSVSSLKKLHHLGVTSISTINDFIITTGLDGTIKKISVNPITKDMQIEHTEKSLIYWIEGTAQIKGVEHLLGFNDNIFIVSRKSNIEFEHKAGGRHRNWAFYYEPERSLAIFTYIQKKQLKSVTFPLEPKKEEEMSWHIKDCHQIVVIPDQENSRSLLISGGEDNVLKFSFLKNNQLYHVKNVYAHKSSIRTISWIQDKDGTLLIFSAGGRAQINVSRVIKMETIQQVVSVLVDSSVQYDAENPLCDPETKYTSIDVSLDSESNIMIHAGCSDGFIRVFSFDQKTVELKKEIFYGKCILKVHRINNWLLTMSTDGLVNFWKIQQYGLHLDDKIKHNQSGINCFDVWKIDDKNHLLVTAGDDQSIYLSSFRLVKGLDLIFTKSSNAIHTAQITGIKFLDNNTILSTGVDQTICKSSFLEEFKLIEKRYTCVSDVKGILKLENDNVLIYGAGIEVL